MIRWLAMAGAAALLVGAADKRNPTCPVDPNWSTNETMKLSFRQDGGRRVLFAEGAVDPGLPARLAAAFKRYKPIEEIRLRSPGGDALAGNQAGALIRKEMAATRIPAGWTCFSACNFVFMGGAVRSVDPGGVFMVHMFTITADGGVRAEAMTQSYDKAVQGIAEVEQSSALLASEDNAFLIRMGVSRKLLTEVMYRQKAVRGKGPDQSTRRCLTPDELRRYSVTNAD
ncbi:hypothetical protein [Sphingomonas sp. SUN039]|uniref:COG3904 family protein n=1 Tax=Sphingomonas sp. SUN039 TaxID=2937787 RepID=UPI002164D18D|nr:hypothetical protein [Sphingomonas sp. SUN039]UVO55193.1 hypothetical protein M0209_14050 [Sphingomonas sp. SUN039]